VPSQWSRLAKFGGLGLPFNICRGTLGSLAMFRDTECFVASEQLRSRALAGLVLENRHTPVRCFSPFRTMKDAEPTSTDRGGEKRRAGDIVAAHATALLKAAAPRAVITYRSALALIARRLT
jgi:hypothetical protein